MLPIYFEFEFHCSDDRKELLIAELAEIVFEGFVESDEGFSAFVPEPDFDEQRYKEILGQYGIGEDQVTKKKIEPRNWNAEWEKNFEPIVVKDKVIIKAPFHKDTPGYGHEIIIQPKNTFGTGHHETTQLVIELMLEEEFTGKKIFDYGCGTGLLALFALSRGAASADAVDIDPWCMDNIEENKKLNNVTELHFSLGDLSVADYSRKYEVVLANINKNILLASFADLSRLMQQEAHLIISGFYEHDLGDLEKEALKHHLHLHRHITKNGWCAAQFKFLVVAL